MKLLERISRLPVPGAWPPHTIHPIHTLHGQPFDVSEWINEGAITGGMSSNALVFAVGVAARCLQLNCQQLAAMPLRYRRRVPEPEGLNYEPPWVAHPDPAWYPNGITDAVFAMTQHVYLYGDAFLWATNRDSTGYPATWTVLDPAYMVVEDADEGGRRYVYDNAELDPQDIRQITRNPGPYLRGTPALDAYWSNLTALWSAESYAAGVFSEGGIPNAIIRSQKRLTEGQARDIQAQWAAAVRGRMSAPAVLPPELDFDQLQFSPKDVMLVESREFDARAIAAAFGVPAPLLNMGISGGLTYATATQLYDYWWRTELNYVAKSLEAALSMWLPRGSWVEFDPTQVIAPDVGGRLDVALKALNAGIMTEDEARSYAFDLPPLTHGEALEEIDEPAGAATSEIAPIPAPSLEVVGDGPT